MKSRSDDLELFLTVIDCGGFSAAAKELDIPVAKISRAIQRLEERLQTTLLTRTTRKVNLTTEGETFAGHVRTGLNQLEQAEEFLRVSKETPVGRLRVDAASPFMQHQIIPHVQEFCEAYPQIQLELNTSEGIINLLEKQTDLAIRIGALEDSTLHAKLLGRSPLHLVATGKYLERYGLPKTPEELEKHRLLGFTSPTSLNNWPIEGGVYINPTLSTNSGTILRDLCLADSGIACLSNFMVSNDIKDGKLIPVLNGLITSTSRELVQAVYYRNTSLSSRIRVFLDFFAAKFNL
ncbi:LysR family transcriptional regulator [Kiloniella litopenaei]|uniref:LysR family transcriptional regulator n=2 Tax=Kiloniella litopenaei TaxID=1549748 RepID=A0A0M2R9A8_9PROT|nr:LysR family transcriptional regulator [Kiloniella litopenaei]